MPFHFRPVERSDFPLMGEWFARPHIKQWWREEHEQGPVEERYGAAVDGSEPTELFIVERDGVAVGFVQRYLVDDNPGWKKALAPAGVPDGAAGIDYLLGVPELIGQGLGPLMISQFVEGTWTRYPGVPVIVADVQQQNRRSWRALEKAGFSRIWAGWIHSDDPSDEGLNYVYARYRPRAQPS